MDKKIKFLHLVGPDTKNSYGIMSQIHKTQNMEEHRFLITSYESSRERFPKLKEFDDNLYIPKDCSCPKRLHRIWYLYRTLSQADVLIWHSLYFTTQKYVWFLAFFRKLLKKSVWIEWGADLYLWRFPEISLKNKIKNYINGKIRKSFPVIGVTFPVDTLECKRQFGENVRCFYTPLPNPYKGASEQIEWILSTRPVRKKWDRITIQVSHNAFTFNNHFYLLEMLKRFKDENIHLLIPISYGMYGINGQFGSAAYCKAVENFAKQIFSKKVSVLRKNIPFDRYLELLWNIDIAVFDFDRPCGLGTLRILVLMEKKIFLPAGSPYYDYLVSQGLPICDTNKIPEMSYEEFIAPVTYTDQSWVYEYMNNDCVMDHWDEMFHELENLFGLEHGKTEG